MDLKPTKKLKPFQKFCMTIGELPSSYLESMTYAEMLMWFCDFLQNTVIPTVNNNAEAVEELQTLFVELKNYVDNYFNNLDVQEEINNKLDEMVEDGTLQEIVANYLNSTAIFAFTNVSEMINATNLINGSKAKTFGYYTKNDGGSALYSIRNKTENDVIDNGSIIQINNELVAELIIQNNVVNFKQFGAKGDGETNDITPIKNCCNFASDNNYNIINNTGSYYVDGDQISLLCSIHNSDNVTFILGESYNKYNSLFIYEHDYVEDSDYHVLSDIFTNKNTLNDNYVNKSFILDTKINYGQRLDETDRTNTILEPFYCIKKYERLWSIDYDANMIVDIKKISDSFEKGFTFDGGKVIQKNIKSYGTSFLTISRNNCIVKNIVIECENNLGSNAVIHVNYGNNIILDNIECLSINSAAGSYNISLENCSNIITRNITGKNTGNTFGNRTVKNWLLADSKVGIWDIHWNAFGNLTIDNCQISGTINIGYGTGILTIQNSYALWLQTNLNYTPIFNGQIICDNSYLNDGIHVRAQYTDDPLRSDFFDNVKLPDVIIKNSIRKYSSDLQDIYISMPTDMANLVTNKGLIILDNVDLRRIYYAQQSDYTSKIYDSVLRDCKNVTTNILNALFALGDVTGSGCSEITQKADITPNNIFGDTFTGTATKNGNVVNINCTGTLSANIGNNSAIVNELPSGFIPSKATYGYITYGETIVPCYINKYGKVIARSSISSGTEIFIIANYIL